jgi:hypothetical protein
MPKLKTDLWEQKQEVRPGPQDKGGKQQVLEGSKVSLFAKIALGSGSVKCDWLISDESLGTVDVPEPADLPSRKEVTLADVPADKAYYSYKYGLSVNGRKQPGYSEYTVWPQHLDLVFEYEKQDGDTSGLNTGDAVVGMDFSALQDGQAPRLWTSEAGGKCQVSVVAGKETTIRPKSPWELLDPLDQAGLARERTYKVTKRAWTAKVRSHDGLGIADTDTDRLKQYVNVAENFTAHCGSLMKLTIGPDDLTKAKKDQKIYLKVTFPAANSLRNVPRPAVWKGTDSSTACVPKSGPDAPDGDAPRVFEEVLTIAADGDAVVVYVQVGYAGGDTCIIEVGATPNYGDHTVYVQNWRKLKVDMFHGNPAVGASQVSTHSVLRGDSTAGFSDNQKTVLETEFKKMFIEFTEDRKLFYDAADLGNADAQRARIVDGTFVGSDGKVVVTPWWPVLYQLSKSKRPPAAADTWWVAWIDYIADTFNTTVDYHTLHAGAPDTDFDYNGPGGFFKWDPNTTQLSVTRIVWKVNTYADIGGVKGIGVASVVPAFEANRVGLAADHVIDNPDEATVDEWVEFINWKKFKIKAPPARFDDNGVGLQLSVTVTFGRLPKFVTNGCAIGGNLWMCTYNGNYHDNGLMGVVLHEMGHNMGMAYGLKGISSVQSAKQMIDHAEKVQQEIKSMFAVGGRSSENMTPGIKFPDKAPAGYYYLGRGHTGGHCSHGVSESDRQKESYSGAAGADCIMFGESDMSSSAARTFCDDCIKYIKGTDVRDITKDW